MRPLIIVSPSVTDDLEEIKLSRVCFRAVEAAGGLALAADYFRADELAERADGILLSGGGDIEPSLSGDEPDREHRGFICLERDRFELELVKRAAEKGIPILGICRGEQVIAAAFGGHIIQHIEGHGQSVTKQETSHYVNIKKNSLLYDIVKTERIPVNSFHHQAAGECPGLNVSAMSDDGWAEAVEGRDGFVLGVQWHPEYLCGDEKQMRIFRALVEAAGRYGDAKNTVLPYNGRDMLYSG